MSLRKIDSYCIYKVSRHNFQSVTLQNNNHHLLPESKIQHTVEHTVSLRYVTKPIR